MAVKDTPINGIDTGWDDFKGGRVETFIKQVLRNPSRFDPSNNTLYYFASDADATSWDSSKDLSLTIGSCPFTFSGWVYKLDMTATNTGGTSPTFTTVAGTAVLSLRFASYYKGVTDSQWISMDEDRYITIQYDANSKGEYTTYIDSANIPSSRSTYSVDMYKVLGGAGTHRVKITLKGADSNSTSSLVFNVNITTLSLNVDSVNWYEPFIQGKSYQVTGLYITSNINKKLHVKLSGGTYSTEHTVNIGTQAYTSPTYSFKNLVFPTANGVGLTGIFAMEMWVTNTDETVSTPHFTRYLMCVASGDTDTAQLVTTLNLRSSVENFGGAVNMYYFSIYNKGLSTGDVVCKYTIKYSDGTAQKEMSFPQSNITCGIQQVSTLSLEEDTYDMGMKLTEVVTIGEVSRTVYNNMTVGNSNNYAPTANASIYVNPASRTNSDGQPSKVHNEIDGEYANMTLVNMDFIDYVDGWTVDCNSTDTEAVKAAARKCLKIPARSRVTLPYTPLSSVQAAGKTIEFTFKTMNATNYDVPVISIASNPTATGFQGIVIKPTKVLVHSRDSQADSAQSYPFREEDTLNVLVGIFPKYKDGYNYCIIYVNGAKVKEFKYDDTDSWTTAANVILGSDYCDLYLYNFRMYDTAIGTEDGQNNYIASLGTVNEKKTEKAKIKSVLDDYGTVSYEKIKGVYNTFVVEMHPGYTYPSRSHGVTDKDYEAVCDVEFEYTKDFVADANKRKVTIKNCWMSGQGTSSMNYWDWNERWRTDKRDDTEVTFNGVTTTGKQSFTWDGGNHSFKIKRATAKKNYASQTQSHKMGATASFTELHDACVGANEASKLVAVYQYPFYGFLKTNEGGGVYSYEFLGMFTFGPDKGDKDTFGYDSATESLEGSNHGLKPVAFMYPPSKVVKYDRYKDGKVDSTWYGINLGNNNYQDSWELGNAGSNEWMTAYNVIYNNHTMFHGVTSTLAQINADVEAWENKTDADGHSYQRFEFYTDGVYDLYYKDEVTGKYASTDINLLTQLGLTKSTFEASYTTLAAREERLKVLRRENFKNTSTGFPSIWNKDDVLFHTAYTVIFGASDNYEKNFYPYKLGTGKWRLRQDDLDTIFATDNQGIKNKKYSIEEFDWTDSNKVGYVFKGEDSALLHLVMECYYNDFIEMGRNILDKMKTLGGKNTGNTLTDLMGFFDKYFWDKAQRYFTKSTYNADTEHSYENAFWTFNNRKDILDVDTSPLAQVTGDDLSGERAWVEQRLVYCMSRFGYGPFADKTGYANTSLGRISFRTQQSQSFTLTPAMDLYPFIAHEQSDKDAPSSRVLAGTSWTTKSIGGGNTNTYITAADYLEDLGDLCGLKVDANTLEGATISIGAKRLKKLKIGDATASNVTSLLRAINLSQCDSLEEIDARNLTKLEGTIDLTRCPRIKTALFQGTGITGVNLIEGSKIQTLALPSGITSINIARCMHLTNFSMQGYSTVDSFRFITGNNTGFATLKSCYDAGSTLSYVRVTGVNYTTTTTDASTAILDMLIALLSKHGITAEGVNDDNSYPFLEGTITLGGDVDGRKVTTICNAFDVVPSKNMTGFFTGLKIVVTGTMRTYINFEDSNTKAICVANWDTGGDGELDTDEAAAVTTVYQMFPSYSSTPHLGSFNEFQYFTGVTELKYRTFYGQEDLTSIKIPDSIVTIYNEVFEYCKGLTTITLPKVTTIGNNSFIYCTGLKSAYLPECTKFDGYSIFMGCTALATISIPKLASIGERCFESCSSLTSINVSLLTTIPSRTFLGCSKLVVATLGANVTSISDNAFNSCSVLKSIGLNTFPLLESIGSQAFWETALEGSLNCVKCTSVGARCFENTKLTSVNFPKVTSIQWRVLYNVGTLTSATFTSATAIGDSAFTYCKNLETLNLTPSIITIIESNAFCECNSLNGEYNFTSCSSVGYGAFMGSKSTNLSVSFPSLSTLGERAFEGTVLTSIASLGNIENIPSRCFFESLIETLTIPSTVTTIGDHSFDGCTKLANLTFANSKNIISLGYASFQNVPFSGTLDFSNVESVGGFCFHEAGSSDGFSVTGFALGCEINARAFWDSKVKVIDLKNCTIIKENAFNGCKQLESIGLLTNVVSIEGYAFYGAGFKGGNIILHAPNLASLDGSAFRDSLSLKKITNLGKITTLPDNGVWGVFRSCKNLESVVFPNGLTSIAQLSFYECSSLSDISWNNVIRLENEAFAFALTKKEYTIPITSMHGYGVFRGCYATSLIFPNLVSIDETTSIYGAMNDCKQLTKVFFGESFTSSGDSVFRGCSALKLLICKATTPPQLGADCFSGTHANLNIFVPLASVSAYQGADVWSGVSGKIVGYTEVTTLPSTPDASLNYLVGTDVYKYDADASMWLKYNPTTGYFSVDVVFYDRLVGDGTATMNLGVAYSTNTIVTFDFVNSGNVGSKNITWVYKAYSSKTFITIITNDNTSVRVGIGASGNSYSGLACGAKVNALHRFAISMDLKNREAWVGNGTHVSVPRDDSSTGDPDGINWNLAAAAISIYEVKITDLDGNLLHDFKPAMMGSLVGMFDEVESKFVSQSNTEGAYTVANDD